MTTSSTVHSTSRNFKNNARDQLANEDLQAALNKARGHFVDGRATARDNLPEFDDLRDQARGIKDHTLEHLDFYLEAYEEKVVESGGHVHWARTAADAQQIVLDICRSVDAKQVNKGKSMIGEEIEINKALEADGIRPIETDLGEYIIQLRGELPSHIIAPAVHLTKAQVEASFRENHTELDEDRVLEEPLSLLDEARTILRKKYFEAEVGITGANLLIAETGSSIIVTNEGNGDLSQLIPKVHIVLASLEKIVPTLEDAATILRVLARSATGQEFSSYTTLSTGPKREGDPDGPEQYHVILLDNGRTDMLGTEFEEMLRCIRCGACMNHCPVYQSVGGHAYGWVYPGPMGSVLSPGLIGVDEAGHLPNASSFCGRCEEVCPMHIPLPKMMRHWREREFESHLSPGSVRVGLGVWSFFARRPRLYQLATGLQMRMLSWMGRKRGRLSSVPLAKGWTKYRELPAPQGRTFQSRWRSGERV
ncbi:MAG: iron-sulfur cluster-binding protein [Rhodospirillaceae bacterium]|jgi:L-lactate dehydrogenase complex protein LldF|nr:iron-sulfur cluster-binding protein [Rhodospirillaceae bacterium]MBT5944084.1 iron-sulfur cluster-binding protein [Rhodospirillaceae bacterium]MBT6402971.1 iron-sulfur cluster-binding protein [Rhodospirillaceae bacterium]MBT6537048.1 iron-sulfur cluster-binding protein [Rhodospirillaceae bacterium]MBT7361139.1 iron-sulfur cluster-binding protein [Rhodospirillaceae bacterium]